MVLHTYIKNQSLVHPHGYQGRFVNVFKKALHRLRKMRKHRLISLFLVFVLIATSFWWVPSMFQPKKTEAAWYDDSWTYRQAITVTVASSSSDITNLETLITVNTSSLISTKLQSSCQDLRFTNSSAGGRLLPYYIDSGCNTSATKIWVLVDLVPKNTTSYTMFMYYGNPSAVAGSDSTTFNLFNGLVGYWNLNESSANSCTGGANDNCDLSVSGDDGAWTGNATNASGKYSNGVSFDGNGDFVNMGDPSSGALDFGTGDFTLAAWFQTNTLSLWTSIINKGAYGDIHGYGLGVSDSNKLSGDIQGATGGSNQHVLGSTSLSSGTWYHGVAVFDRDDQVYVYVNGVLDGSAAYGAGNTTSVSNTASFLLGSYQDQSKFFLNGLIDEARVYNRALSATEVAQLYNLSSAAILTTTKPVVVPTTSFASEENALGPIGYWKFDEGYGTTTYDSSSNANNGTMFYNAAWKSEDQCMSGKCLYFDGSTGYVKITDPSNGSLDPTSAATFEAWIRPIDAGENVFGRVTSAFSNVDVFVQTLSNNTLSLCAQTGGTTDTCTGQKVAAESWNHIAVVYTSANSRNFYVNGVLVASNSSTNSLANAGNKLIGNRAADDRTFHGYIDDVKVYNYARSAAQIKTDYASRASALSKGSSAILGALPRDPLSNGLVGYWKMDESSWTNDCSTATATDSSGNANTGKSCPNSTGPTGGATGKFGYGGSFDGTNDYINIADSTSLEVTNITISAWMNATSLGGTILQKSTLAGTDGYSLDTNSSKIRFCAAGGCASSSTTLSTGAWTFVVATFDGTTTKFYLNGETDGTSTTITSVPTNALVLRIGADSSASTLFTGSLDEVRVYNHALTSGEVRQLYTFAPGPVGYWSFEEGSGSTANDTSGNANTGTATGTTIIPGKFGKSRNFNGSSDYISVGNPSSLNISRNITVEAWVKFSTSQLNKPIVARWGTDQSYLLEVDFTTANELGFFIRVSDVNKAAISTNTYNDDKWHHVAGVYNGTNVLLYIDGGIEQITGDATVGPIDTPSQDLAIGAYNNPSGYFNGSVDEVRIYNYARNPKQIVEDMNAGHPSVGTPVGSAVGYWKMDEGYGTTANDATPNGNNLTLSTASWTNSGKFGKAWDGTGARWLSRSDDSDFDFAAADDFSISIWFKSDSASNPAAVEYLVNKASSTVAGYAVYANTNGTVCLGIDDDTTWTPDDTACTATDIYDATWHYLTANKICTSKIELFVDALSRGSDTTIAATGSLANSLSLYVGDRDGTDNGDEFNGDLDEVKIYRYALTSDEVKTEYNRGSSLVLGALSDNSSYQPQAANQEYCVPGDSTSCASPVGEWKFDEGTGTTANDTTGRGNTGTLMSGSSLPTWITGKIGKGINFSANGYVSVPDSDDWNFGSGDLTVSFWVNVTAHAANKGMVFQGEATGNWSIFSIEDAAAGGIRWLIRNSGALVMGFTTTTTLTTGTWYYIAAVRSGSTFSIYINGVQDETTGTSATALDDLAYVLKIGSRESTVNTNRFNGIIDNVRIYKYARTQAQIEWEYNRGAPVGYWKFDECQGTIANDSSGNGYSGTITVGASGTQTAVGTCLSGNSAHAWNNGVTGKFNYSLKFDGTDDYVWVADTANLRFDASTQDFSLFAWVKRTTTGTEYILSKEDADDDGWRLMFNSSNQVLCSEDATDVTSLSGITDTNWHHIGCTIPRTGNGKVYIDGIANGSPVSMGTDAMATTAIFRIATRAYTPTSYFNGQIDDVKVYNYALTAQQVKSDYSQGAVRFGPASGAP